MRHADRLLSVLLIFGGPRPALTVGEIATASKVSLSTAHRDVRQLVDHGFLEPVGELGYALGPAIAGLDNIVRFNDVLIHSSGELLSQLQLDSGPAVSVLLCRRYRNRIVCVAARGERGEGAVGVFERGQRMSILNNAFSLAILAHLPRVAAERLMTRESSARTDDWNQLQNQIAGIRKARVVISPGEQPLGITSIAGCIFGGGGRPIGSVGAVLLDERAAPPVVARISALVQISARRLSRAMTDHEDTNTQERPRYGSR